MALLLALLLSSYGLLAAAVDWDVVTPLDEYVHRDDGHFMWTEVASYNYDGVTVYVLNMTSQMYQDDAYSTQSIWWHWMGVAIPDEPRYLDAAVMLVDGGSNGNTENPPDRADSGNLGIVLAARDSGVIAAYIKAVPNQPIWFHNDPNFERRTEDRLIAWTWRDYLDTPEPNPTVIARMPMTKSVKRAMDTVAEVCKQRLPDSNVNRFIITGASKRGWTTWSIAATDKRVVAIIPLVFSLLNMDEALKQHNRNMDGDWSFAFNPYWRENLTQEFTNPKTLEVWSVEDMYTYRERLTLPIMAMSSTGDEFFLADDNHLWWDGIPSQNKLLLMLPNAQHTMAPHYLKIYETGLSFASYVLQNKPLPKVSWTMHDSPGGGSIRFVTDPPPNRIRGHRAVTLATDTRRDFRLFAGPPDDVTVHPVLWRRNVDVVDLGDGVYEVETTEVDGQWVGFFIEGDWEGQSGFYNYRLSLTSQVNVIPWTFPAPACHDAETCWGKLV